MKVINTLAYYGVEFFRAVTRFMTGFQTQFYKTFLVVILA